MIFNINSTRGHTGSLLVFSITDALLDCRSRIDSSVRQFAMGSALIEDPRFDNCFCRSKLRHGGEGGPEGGRGQAGREGGW